MKYNKKAVLSMTHVLQGLLIGLLLKTVFMRCILIIESEIKRRKS